MGKNRVSNIIYTYTSNTERKQQFFKCTTDLTKANNFMLDSSNIHIIIYFYCMVITLTYAKLNPLLKYVVWI